MAVLKPALRGPPALHNPALHEFARQRSSLRRDWTDQVRVDVVRRFAFAVPTAEAVEAVRRFAPEGVVEIGAGTGDWAYVMAQTGIDVAAFDVAPAPNPDRKWFGTTASWHPVQLGDESTVERFPDRALLLVWPTRNEVWPADALARYRRAGGCRVIYVGEGPGGRTGDDVFHARLGDLIGCSQCRLGAVLSPCICTVTADWQRRGTVALPHWPGYHDDVHLYKPADPPRDRHRWTMQRR